MYRFEKLERAQWESDVCVFGGATEGGESMSKTKFELLLFVHKILYDDYGGNFVIRSWICCICVYVCVCKCVNKRSLFFWNRCCLFLLFIYSVVYHSRFLLVCGAVSVFILLALITQLSTAAVEQHIYYQLNGYYYSSFVRFSFFFFFFKQTNNFHFLFYFLICVIFFN